MPPTAASSLRCSGVIGGLGSGVIQRSWSEMGESAFLLTLRYRHTTITLSARSTRISAAVACLSGGSRDSPRVESGFVGTTGRERARGQTHASRTTLLVGQTNASE